MYQVKSEVTERSESSSAVGKQLCGKMRERAGEGDPTAQRWIELFDSLGNYLRVKST